jgi:hypothetical protein
MPRAGVSEGPLATQVRSTFRGPWVLPRFFLATRRHGHALIRRPLALGFSFQVRSVAQQVRADCSSAEVSVSRRIPLRFLT